MAVLEHLQNLWTCFDYKRERDLEWLCLKWSIFFPDLHVCEQIETGNEHYCPGLPQTKEITLINLEVLRKQKKTIKSDFLLELFIISVMCMSGHFCYARLLPNSQFSVLCSKNFEVTKLAGTRYGETNVDIHPFLILNMEKSKFLNAIFLCDNNNSLYKLS